LIDLSRIPADQPVRVIIGAGAQSYPGWIATHKEQLDLLQSEDWAASFGARPVDAFLCEHVWEHLTETEGRRAASLCFRYLRPGGYVRCAVPDGNFPNAAYQLMVRPGGPGAKDHAAADHKVLYDYKRLTATFTAAGFDVDLLEYCDETGRLHYNQWSSAEGPVYRSLLSDHRNKDGTIGFVSLIIDARKPWK
jgi:predicted SAM-dependent methyltransferase